MLVVRVTTLLEIAPMSHAALYVINLDTTHKLAQKQEDAVFAAAEIMMQEIAP